MTDSNNERQKEQKEKDKTEDKRNSNTECLKEKRINKE